jgi:hypothetical protein
MPQQFRCEACNCVEHANPHTLCNHCSQDYWKLRELATRIRRQFDLWHLSPFEAIRTGLNRLVAEINSLRGAK